MPEIEGISLEELNEIFKARTPASKFKNFQYTPKDEAPINIQERTRVVIGKGELTSAQVENVDQEAV
jgi:hypothetical protein